MHAASIKLLLLLLLLILLLLRYNPGWVWRSLQAYSTPVYFQSTPCNSSPWALPYLRIPSVHLFLGLPTALQQALNTITKMQTFVTEPKKKRKRFVFQIMTLRTGLEKRADVRLVERWCRRRRPVCNNAHCSNSLVYKCVTIDQWQWCVISLSTASSFNLFLTHIATNVFRSVYSRGPCSVH